MTHLYASQDYVAALAEAVGGRAIAIPAWGSFVLARPIATGGKDGAGAYPMAVLEPTANVAEGVRQAAAQGLVSVVLVADPLSGPPEAEMAAAFDLARPFKTHHLVEPAAYAPSKHHRQEIRRAARRCTVEQAPLTEQLPAWTALYAGLTQRHGITGPAAFSPGCFELLARTPAVAAFAARVEGEIVAMSLWFEHQGVGYNHLGASAPAGYAAGASYALYDAAIQHFATCRLLNLGGGAGLGDDAGDGLTAFKRGFASRTVQAWLYGKVLDEPRYAALAQGRTTSFFPAYRG